MGLLSSKSSSKKNYDTTSAAGEASVGDDSQNLIGVTLGKGASLTLSDHGAVKQAIGHSSETSAGLLKLSGEAIRTALQASSSAQQATVQAYMSAQGQAGAVNADQLAKLGLGALVLIVLALGYVAARQ